LPAGSIGGESTLSAASPGSSARSEGAFSGAAAQPVLNRRAAGSPSSFTYSAGGYANDLPPVITVPLAFTTRADGATRAQAAALGRLESAFAAALAGPARNPDDPAYAKAWRAAQTLSDSNFEQQFGTRAFIEAQLAQYHGGIQ
jgi:hypothetical protein